MLVVACCCLEIIYVIQSSSIGCSTNGIIILWFSDAMHSHACGHFVWFIETETLERSHARSTWENHWNTNIFHCFAFICSTEELVFNKMRCVNYIGFSIGRNNRKIASYLWMRVFQLLLLISVSFCAQSTHFRLWVAHAQTLEPPFRSKMI